MRKIIPAAMLILGTAYLLLGIFLLMAPLLWNSAAGAEGIRETVRSLIGRGTAIDDDTAAALSLILIFQGIKLMERRDRTIGSILYSLWLLVPSLLAIAAIDSDPGIIPRAVSNAIPGTALSTLVFSIFLTIVFRLLISMARNVVKADSTDPEPAMIEDTQKKKALPAPRKKPDERPVYDIVIADEAPTREEAAAEPGSSKAEGSGTSSEVHSAIEKIIRTSKGKESYQSISRKRKRLKAMPPDELADAINSVKGLRVYSDSKGQIGNVEDELNGMILYSFSPFTIIAENKKGSLKKIRCEDLAVPAFSMEQATELAEKAVKEYSKGGFSYSALEGELKVSGKDAKISKDSFIVPWYRKELSYADPAIGDKLFALDFHLKYAMERGLVPYSRTLGEDKAR